MITMPMSDAPNIGRAMSREPQPYGRGRRRIIAALRRLLRSPQD